MSNGMFDLTDMVAIVTGGNGGIGFGVASAMATAGAHIVVAARDRRKTEEAVKRLTLPGVRALGLTTDVTDEASVASMVEAVLNEFGRIDILVNNAGLLVRKPPQDHKLEEWNQVINTNLNGTFLCSREVYPHMAGSGGGKVINVGSMTSIFGSDWVASYSASKGAVVQLTKSLAIAWAKDNIQVNAILPGWIHTDLTATIKTQNPERYEMIKSRIPYGRWGEPEEMGGAAVFLASSASNYVTGVALPIDGGYTSF